MNGTDLERLGDNPTGVLHKDEPVIRKVILVANQQPKLSILRGER